MNTSIQDDVVAGMLSLRAKMPVQPPEQRVEPINGARQFCRDLNEPVETLNVPELVSEDDANAIIRPCRCFVRKQDAGPQNTQCSEAAAFTLQEKHGSSDAERGSTKHNDRRLNNRICSIRTSTTKLRMIAPASQMVDAYGRCDAGTFV